LRLHFCPHRQPPLPGARLGNFGSKISHSLTVRALAA
jgi:hypothetical protein